MTKNSPGVLFLDIDGVLCTDRAYYAFGQDKNRHKLRTLDPIGIKIINRLCEDFDLDLVISSTWRHSYPVFDILLTHGFTGKQREGNSKTPRSHSRGAEIKEWLDEHGKNLHRCLIVDDCSDGIKGTDLEKCWVQTDYHDGILTAHFEQAKFILKEQKKRDEILFIK